MATHVLIRLSAHAAQSGLLSTLCLKSFEPVVARHSAQRGLLSSIRRARDAPNKASHCLRQSLERYTNAKLAGDVPHISTQDAKHSSTAEALG